MKSVKQTDILTGSIPKQLLLFFLPIWFGTLFQQLYNTADTLIVGNFVGTNALAAVGATGPFVNLLVGLFVGLCSGAGVVIAQSWGAHDPDAVDRQVHTALVLSIAVGALLTVLGLVTAAPIMRLLGTPDEILPDAALYLRIYFLGMIPQMLYNMGTNILRAIGDSKRPLYFLIAASLVNIVLDVVFIAVFGWGVMGAALATVLSQVASAVLTLRCIVGSQGMPWHIRAEKLRLHGDVFAAICTIGVPAAAQSAMYNISNMFIQSSMNSFGTSTIAAWGVYGKIDFLFWMTINSLGIAITTFAGQNFGARQYDRVRRGVRVCLAMAACTTLVISFTFYNLAEVLFRLFSQDDAVVAVGVGMMHVLTPVYITYVCIEVLAGALRLHGDVFAAICTIGVPAAAQSAMYNISNMFIQSSMNSFGTSTIAAWGVYGKIDFLFWMTINSLGIAITTFAGQNFGARQYDRVRRGVRVCLAMAACTTLVISFTFYNLAEVLFRLFSQDDAVVAVGVGMMHVLTPVYITYVCIEVLAGALRGCGDVRVPTLITVFFVCGLRMLWLFIAVPIRHEVATVEMSYPITWSLASALFILYYVKGGWMQRCAEKWEKKQAG